MRFVNPKFWESKRVLLTGHTGFKGSWLSLWLQSMGAQVYGLAQMPPTNPALYDEADVESDMQKSIIKNNQILDFQTQVFLTLQSLQANALDDPGTFNSAKELREVLESGRENLPLNAKPRMSVQNNRSFYAY